jgi:hypothetical protein
VDGREAAGRGYDMSMTAPGQEPDEVLTAQPVGDDEPDLNAIGDNHMPEDLRREERGQGTTSSERAEARDRDEEAADPDRSG